jgi:hypothetical protein
MHRLTVDPEMPNPLSREIVTVVRKKPEKPTDWSCF